MYSVLIADDHYSVRIGIEIITKQIPGISVETDFAANGMDVLEKISERTYDLIITDVNMPGISGIDLVKAMQQVRSDQKILIVSVNPTRIFAKRFLAMGVLGYINKCDSDTELTNAIRCSLSGQQYLTDEQKLLAVQNYIDSKKNNPFEKLSSREFEVIMLLLKGEGLLEIANALHIGVSTASTYKTRIFKKLRIDNVIDLNRMALQHGVVVE